MKRTRLRVAIVEALALGFQELIALDQDEGLGINVCDSDARSIVEDCPTYVLQAPVSVTKYPQTAETQFLSVPRLLNACCLLRAVLKAVAGFRSSSDDRVVAERERDAVARLTAALQELLQECEDLGLIDWNLVC